MCLMPKCYVHVLGTCMQDCLLICTTMCGLFEQHLASCLRTCLQSRLPELQELQQQLSSAHEEVADLQYAANEQQTAAAQLEQAAAEKLEAAHNVAKVSRVWLCMRT